MRYLYTGYRLTVRTLSFHLNNVGSNPASLKIIPQYLKAQRKLTFGLTIKCASIIPIKTSTAISGAPTTKLLIKKNFIFCAWFLLLYKKFFFNNPGAFVKTKISIMPVKKKKYSLIRAPMAFKTWSFEYFKYCYYKLALSARLTTTPPTIFNTTIFNTTIFNTTIFNTNFIFKWIYIFFFSTTHFFLKKCLFQFTTPLYIN